MLAAVVAAPHLAGGSRPNEREGCPPVLQTHGFEGRPETVGEPVTYLCPGSPTVAALRDAGASEMLLIPGTGSLLGRRYEQEFRLARMQHQQVRIAANLVVQVGPLLPRLAA